ASVPFVSERDRRDDARTSETGHWFWRFYAGDDGGLRWARGLAIAAPGREARIDSGSDRTARRGARILALTRAMERAFAGERRIPARQFQGDLSAGAGCDGLWLRLCRARGYFRPRHLGLHAGAAADRRNRRHRHGLRAEHDAG